MMRTGWINPHSEIYNQQSPEIGAEPDDPAVVEEDERVISRQGSMDNPGDVRASELKFI